jgi:glycerophosphoryl diester phosphodiesterase
LKSAESSYIFVVAHRGDWRNAPENSLQAISNCIAMGVDMVEIDVRQTKDGVFVLMHDETVDRTTNGKGKVYELTWPQLQQLYLKDPLEIVTKHKIPTLEEALSVSKNKILLNLDKVYGQIDEIVPILRDHGMLDQIVFKGWMKDWKTLSQEVKTPLDSILFMPIVSLDESNWQDIINSYDNRHSPVAFEILFKKAIEQDLAITMIKSKSSRIWINSLWPFFNAGHDDERAVTDPDGSYGWLINQGATIIQTDRPEMLIDYLREKNLK